MSSLQFTHKSYGYTEIKSKQDCPFGLTYRWAWYFNNLFTAQFLPWVDPFFRLLTYLFSSTLMRIIVPELVDFSYGKYTIEYLPAPDPPANKWHERNFNEIKDLTHQWMSQLWSWWWRLLWGFPPLQAVKFFQILKQMQNENELAVSCSSYI